MPDSFKYRAFISYSHADRRWGDWLHRTLETYRVPKRLVGTTQREGTVPARLFPLFRDREELPTSADLGGNLREALVQSRFIIVICSPRSARSHWCNEEILSFKRLGREHRVLPFIIEGEPHASEGTPGTTPADECFPPALRFALGADGELSTVRSEPIAADARPGRDGRDNARLKLLAGLLGVDYDLLRQRERERLRQRRRRQTLLLLGLAAIFTGVWRYEAHKRQTLITYIARQAADRAEEYGREYLLAGEDQAAADRLDQALKADPGREAARLMRGIALRHTGGLAAVMAGEEDAVTFLDLSPTGAHLLVGSLDDRTAALYELPAHRLLRRIPYAGRERLPGSAFNATGDKLITPDERGWGIREVVSGARTALPEGRGTRACFLGDGTQVLWFQSTPGAEEHQPLVVKVLEAASSREVRRFTLDPGWYGSLQVDAQARTALVGGFAPALPGATLGGGEPRLIWFQLASGQVIARLPRSGEGQLPMDLSRDGDRLLYLRADGVWEARSPAGVLWTLPKPPGHSLLQARWSGDGREALVVERGILRVLDAADGHVLWQDLTPSTPALPATDAAGTLLAYGDLAGTVHLRGLRSGQPLATFADRHGWPARGGAPHDALAQFTPDGRFLLLAGAGKAVKLWDWRRTQPDPRLLGDPQDRARPGAPTFSADGTVAGVRRDDGRVALWDTATGHPLPAPDTRAMGGAWTLALSPDGRQVLAGAQAAPDLAAAQVWDGADGHLIATLDDTSSDTGTAPLANAPGGPDTRAPGLEQHLRVAWAGDRLLTVNFNRGRATVWDAARNARLAEVAVGPPTRELTATAPGSGTEPGPPRIATAANGSRWIVAGLDGIARVFTTRDGQPVAALPHPVPGLVTAELDAGGTLALTRSADGTVAVWEVAPARLLARLASGTPAAFNDAHFSRASDHAATATATAAVTIAVACADACVRLWDLATHDWLRTFREETPPGASDASLGAPFAPSAPAGTRIAQGFLSLQMDPQGLWVAAVNDDGHLCLWELATGRELMRWTLDIATREALLTTSPQGDLLTVTGLDGAVRVFHLPRGS